MDRNLKRIVIDFAPDEQSPLSGAFSEITYYFYDADNPDEPFGRQEFVGPMRKRIKKFEKRFYRNLVFKSGSKVHFR